MYTTGGWSWELDPADQPYPDYVADPRRPSMNVSTALFSSHVPRTTSRRVLLDAGTRYTAFKVTDPAGINELAVDLEAGLFAQFDAGHSLDNIGWDGVFGAFLVQSWSETVIWRGGYRHLSAHLGDEYIEATGRRRTGYTREGFVLGVCYRWSDPVMIYVEPDWAWYLGNSERQKRWAMAGGLQYEGSRSLWNGTTAVYAGLHVRAFQESGWNPDVVGQIGLHVTRDPRSANLRLALGGYVGRAILGEYALDFYEAYASLGVMLDFY